MSLVHQWTRRALPFLRGQPAQHSLTTAPRSSTSLMIATRQMHVMAQHPTNSLLTLSSRPFFWNDTTIMDHNSHLYTPQQAVRGFASKKVRTKRQNSQQSYRLIQSLTHTSFYCDFFFSTKTSSAAPKAFGAVPKIVFGLPFSNSKNPGSTPTGIARPRSAICANCGFNKSTPEPDSMRGPTVDSLIIWARRIFNSTAKYWRAWPRMNPLPSSRLSMSWMWPILRRLRQSNK